MRSENPLDGTECTQEAVTASHWTRMLRIMIIGVAGSLLAVVGVNVVVDPKGLYQIVEAEGFNAYKPFQNYFTSEVKALALYRYRPDTLVFGASTVTFGIDPHCPAPGIPGVSRIYNYGGAGSTVSDLLVNLPDVVSVGSVRRLVVEARFEYQRFVAEPEAPPDAHKTAETPLDRMVGRYLPARYLTTYIRNLFSWGELVLSLQTVRANRELDKSFLFRRYAENGSYDQEWLRRWSARVITEQSVHGHAINMADFLISKVSNDMAIDLSYVDRLAEAARTHQIDVDIFITPVHVSELLMFKEGGIWPLYEKFKIDLLDRVDEARARWPSNMRLFDFGRLSPIVSQSIKAADFKGAHEPFSDPVHFKTVVGDMILGTVLKCATSLPPDDFGLELERSNIAEHLVNERNKLVGYADAHPELVDKINRTIKARLERPAT